MDDEQPDHNDGSPTCGLVVLPVVLVLRGDNGDDDMAYGHTDGTNEKRGSSTPAVDPHDGGDSGDEHGNTDDTSSEETDGAVAEAELAEDDGGVVEDGVDSGPSGRCQYL